MPQATSLRRVLVVDDEAEVREALKKILLKEHFQVESASSAQEAISMAHDSKFDLVITDLVMPGISGLELLHNFRETCPATRVIIITAYGNWDSYLDAMNSGAFNYVTKPVKKGEIVRLVRSALDLPLDDPGDPSGHRSIGT